MVTCNENAYGFSLNPQNMLGILALIGFFFGDTKINLCRIKITNKQFWPKSRGTHKKFPKIPNFKIMTKVIQHWSEQHDHNSLHVGRCLVPSMFILLIDLEDSLLSSWWSFSRNFLCDAEGHTRTWLLYWDSAQK